MELTALNSLAETGVGLNLAFGLVKSIRSRFAEQFKEKLDIQVETIRASLADSNLGRNGRSISREAVKVDDIAHAFERRSTKVENFFVTASFIVATGLTYFLLRAALDPEIDPGRLGTWAMFFLVWMPISMTMVVQYGLYLYSNFCLGKRKTEYQKSLELMDDFFE